MELLEWSYLLFIFICVKSCSLLFMLNGNPKPEQLNKASEFTGLMDNMRYLYDDKHVSEINIKSPREVFTTWFII